MYRSTSHRTLVPRMSQPMFPLGVRKLGVTAAAVDGRIAAAVIAAAASAVCRILTVSSSASWLP